MKAAVTYENGEVFQHFGRTPQFKVFEIENGEVVRSEVIDTNGTGHGALAGFLAAAGVNVLICGGIGGGAIAAMESMGIDLYAGASGDADEVIRAYIAGQLPKVGDATCDHNGHGDHEGHSCGHGDHGGHGCGHGDHEGHGCGHGDHEGHGCGHGDH